VAESWTIEGHSLGACNCRVSPCPCTTGGGNPTEGECKAIIVAAIEGGNYGNTDLSGLNVALVMAMPGFVFDGNWDVGLVIDERADDRQFEALEAIFSGQAGGPFADFAGLIGNLRDAERGRFAVEVSEDMESASASVGGSEFRYTPLKTPDGRRTKLINAALGFGEELLPGKAEGQINSVGITGEIRYGDIEKIKLTGP
jgi:hypothetical protein